MTPEEIIEGLESLMDDRKTYFNTYGDDEIFRYDYAVLEAAKELIQPKDRRSAPMTLAYREGYFKALVDVQNWLSQHTDCLKMFRVNNAAGITAFLHCAIENLDTFMRKAETARFHVTKDKKRISFQLRREKDEYTQNKQGRNGSNY